MSETHAPVPTGAPPAERSSRSSRLRGTLSFLIPALVVTGIILVLVQIQAQTEAATANVVNLLPIGFAFAAGMVASVNPCGFLLLPTYITFQLGSEETGFYQAPLARRSVWCSPLTDMPES